MFNVFVVLVHGFVFAVHGDPVVVVAHGDPVVVAHGDPVVVARDVLLVLPHVYQTRLHDDSHPNEKYTNPG